VDIFCYLGGAKSHHYANDLSSVALSNETRLCVYTFFDLCDFATIIRYLPSLSLYLYTQSFVSVSLAVYVFPKLQIKRKINLRGVWPLADTIGAAKRDEKKIIK
jgi:hypothetical protein